MNMVYVMVGRLGQSHNNYPEILKDNQKNKRKRAIWVS